MNFNDRFASNDPTEKGLVCTTCGAVCDEPELHNDWHTKLEQFEEWLLNELKKLGVKL